MVNIVETARAVVNIDGQQAQVELDNLEKKAIELRKELKKLDEVNDLAGYKKKKKALTIAYFGIGF